MDPVDEGEPAPSPPQNLSATPRRVFYEFAFDYTFARAPGVASSVGGIDLDYYLKEFPIVIHSGLGVGGVSGPASSQGVQCPMPPCTAVAFATWFGVALAPFTSAHLSPGSASTFFNPFLGADVYLYAVSVGDSRPHNEGTAEAERSGALPPPSGPGNGVAVLGTLGNSFFFRSPDSGDGALGVTFLASASLARNTLGPNFRFSILASIAL